MMHGIDISRYQLANLPALVSSDFCFIKATGGSGYVNPNAGMQRQVAPRRAGFYHFAGDGYPWTTPEAEAQHFLSQWTKLAQPGDIPVLDWEPPAPVREVRWAERWLEIVSAATGTTPLLYCNLSVATQHDWSRVQKMGVKLWLALYGNDARIDGYNPPGGKPGAGAGWHVAIWQYTQHGRLPGYDGDLDLNIAYEDLWAGTKPLLIPEVEGLYA